MAALVAIGSTAGIDDVAFAAARSVASPTLDTIASDVTFLGDAVVTGGLALLLALVLWRREGPRGLVPLLLFVGVGIETLMKYVVPHAGPTPVVRDVATVALATPYAFPSGHAFRTTFLASLVGRTWPRVRAVVWLLAIAVSLTRIYLGAHWLSDVVGGIFLALCLDAVAESIAP